MNEHEQRGVSFGTILMLLLTALVLAGFVIILPRLMGPVDILLEERAMRSTTNLNDSLPELSMSEIPISNAAHAPEVTAEPALRATAAPAATASPAPTAAPAKSVSVNLTFGGSICMDKDMRKSGYYEDSQKYDYSENLSLIADELSSDLTLVTLESITNPDADVRKIPNAPPAIMDLLASVDIDVVALGYNRAMEQGMTGVQATVGEAQKRELETVGAYTSQEDAERIRIFSIDEVDVAVLHYTNLVTSTAKRKIASDNAAYALPVVTVNTGADRIASDIRRAREQGADIVIVSLNWSGNESISTTSTKMKSFMQALADAGADVIVGAGTKAVKSVSWIMGKREDGTSRQTLCAWSLGSLINGERDNGNVTGMLLHLQLSWDGSAVSFESVTYTPTYIWRFKQDSYYRYRVVASDQPAPDGMDESQAANALKAFDRLRETLGDSPVNLRVK